MKSKSIYWKYLLLKIKYIFLRDSYVCTRWIFIFGSDQAQINSVVAVPVKKFVILWDKTHVWTVYTAHLQITRRQPRQRKTIQENTLINPCTFFRMPIELDTKGIEDGYRDMSSFYFLFIEVVTDTWRTPPHPTDRWRPHRPQRLVAPSSTSQTGSALTYLTSMRSLNFSSLSQTDGSLTYLWQTGGTLYFADRQSHLDDRQVASHLTLTDR